MAILATIKEHPALTVAGIVGVLIIVYVINHSGSNSPAGATLQSGGSVDAATGYQTALLGASASANQAAAAVAANKDTIAGQIQLATIAAQQSGAHDAIAGQVATSQINATQQVQSLLAAMSADVSKTASNNDVRKTEITVGGQTEMQRILANALVAQSTNQANVAVAGITSNRDVAIAGYDTSAKIASTYAGASQNIALSHDEHSGGLFGGGGFLGLGIG